MSLLRLPIALCLLLLAGCAEPPDDDRLPAEPAPEPIMCQTTSKPTPEDPFGLVGTRPPEWEFDEWSDGKQRTLEDLRGRVVVIRWWTDGCPYCARSLPALDRLQQEFRDKPVTFIGAYHSKPRGSERPWPVAVETAQQYGLTFPIAYDRMWTTLGTWWLDHVDRQPTSVTFVLDGTGKIVHIHPGPEFYPTEDPRHAQRQADFDALRSAILRAF